MISDIEPIPAAGIDQNGDFQYLQLHLSGNKAFMLTDPKIMECLLRIEEKLDKLLGGK